MVSPTSVPPDRTACPENRDRGSATHRHRASDTIRKKKSTASWGFAPPARGLRPPRIAKAILPPGIPVMSRLRRHAICWNGDRLNAALLSQTQRQRHRRNWLSRKAKRIGQRSIREDRAGGNVPTGAISGPSSLFSGVRQGAEGRTSTALYGPPRRPIFRREILAPFKRLHADPALRSWPCYQAECSRRRRSGAPSTARRCDPGSSPHRFDFDPQHRRQTRSRPDARRSQLGASGERDGGPRLAIKGAN